MEVESVDANNSDLVCWICLSGSSESEASNESLGWIEPCCCRGSLKYVHERCLLRWISVKTSQRLKPNCPACNYTYVIECKSTKFLKVVEYVDKIILFSTPYLVITAISISTYAVMMLYGLHTVIVMYGPKEAIELLGDPPNWNWRSWVCLPLIPVSLMVAKMSSCVTGMVMTALPVIASSIDHSDQGRKYRSSITYLLPWACLLYDHTIRTLRARACRFKSRNWQSGTSLSDVNEFDDYQTTQLVEEINEVEGKSRLAKFLLSAFLFPTLSSIIGNVLGRFKFVRYYLPKISHRSILGGCIISLTEDIFSLVYYRQLGGSICTRRVKNCPENKVLNLPSSPFPIANQDIPSTS